MKFTIDEQYLTSITIKKTWNKFTHIKQEDLTPEQSIEIMNGVKEYSSTHTEDHPEFTKLRNKLEDEGYIQTERGWWNGDTVLKPFTLNGFKFKKSDQFPSASAMYTEFFVARRRLTKKFEK